MTTADISLALLLGPQLRAFQSAGYRVVGVSAPGDYVPELASWGIDHVPLRHATRSWSPGNDMMALGELVGVFRRMRPAVVHTHNPKPGVYGRLAARIAGVRAVVNTVHGLYATPDDRLLKRAVVYGLERLASTCSDAELVQNPEDVTTLKSIGIPASKLQLLGNGVDLRRFTPGRADPASVQSARREMGATGPDDVLVGAVGRLVWEKGYRELFAAARRLSTPGSAVKVAVIGPDDPDKPDAVDASSIVSAQADGVKFLGSRRDMDVLYEAMDVYVLASHREGFPRSAMEAAAMGLPVVATDIRGCRQVVDHGRSGFLVPVNDAEALASAIEKLVDDPGLRAKMGEAGRAKALAEFDDRRVIDLTLATYQRLLGR